jgi:hypothetical protein
MRLRSVEGEEISSLASVQNFSVENGVLVAVAGSNPSFGLLFVQCVRLQTRADQHKQERHDGTAA